MAVFVNRFVFCNDLKRLGSKTVKSLVALETRGIFTSVTLKQSSSTPIVTNTDKAGDDVNKSNEERLKEREERVTMPPSSNNHQSEKSDPSLNLRFRYPEMFPVPFMMWRNPLKEKLERKDMLARRSRVHIPEFYVGSVLRVLISNVHQADKLSSFVGICIQREQCGLKAFFILRNVIDNLGVEMKLELYDPKIQKIEVLRLEKRLDTHLRYLRDAPPEYSTFPLDMKAEVRRTNEVPLNPTKVKLNPRPWTENWYRYDYQGVENIDDLITNRMQKKRRSTVKPWEKYDLMKTYRDTLPEDEISDILSEIQEDIDEHETKHKKRLN